MNKTYHFLTRNRFSRYFYGIYNEYFSYACTLIPNPQYREQKKFIIYGQGRTGSTLLVNILNSHPDIICEREILMDKNLPWDHQASAPEKMLRGKASLFRKKVYGFKTKIYQITKQEKIKSPKTFLKNATNDNWKIIYLKRDNTFEHALSNIIAETLQQYHYDKKGEKSKYNALKIKIDPQKLLKRMQQRIEWAKEDEEILTDIPHHPILYEELSRHTQQEADKIFGFLEIKQTAVKTSLQKTNTKKYSNLINNFDEIQHVLQEHHFERFIDPIKI